MDISNVRKGVAETLGVIYLADSGFVNGRLRTIAQKSKSFNSTWELQVACIEALEKRGSVDHNPALRDVLVSAMTTKSSDLAALLLRHFAEKGDHSVLDAAFSTLAKKESTTE